MGLIHISFISYERCEASVLSRLGKLLIRIRIKITDDWSSCGPRPWPGEEIVQKGSR